MAGQRDRRHKASEHGLPASVAATGTTQFDVCVTVHHQYNDVNNQQDATTFSFINLFKSALQVSGDKFAHPQEHFLTVYTAFGTMHRH